MALRRVLEEDRGFIEARLTSYMRRRQAPSDSIPCCRWRRRS